MKTFSTILLSVLLLALSVYGLPSPKPTPGPVVTYNNVVSISWCTSNLGTNLGGYYVYMGSSPTLLPKWDGGFYIPNSTNPCTATAVYGTNMFRQYTKKIQTIATTYRAVNLQSAVSYYFTVTQYSKNGTESPMTIELRYIPPYGTNTGGPKKLAPLTTAQ